MTAVSTSDEWIGQQLLLELLKKSNIFEARDVNSLFDFISETYCASFKTMLLLHQHPRVSKDYNAYVTPKRSYKDGLYVRLPI